MTEFAIPLVTGQAACQTAGRVWSPPGWPDGPLSGRGWSWLVWRFWVRLGVGAQVHGPAAGGPGRWPGSMGGHSVATACLRRLAAVGDGRQRRTTTYAWTLAVLNSAATAAGNVAAGGAHALGPGCPRQPACPETTATAARGRGAKLRCRAGGRRTETVGDALAARLGVSDWTGRRLPVDYVRGALRVTG